MNPDHREHLLNSCPARAALTAALLATLSTLGLAGCAAWPKASASPNRVALEDFVGDQPRPGVLADTVHTQPIPDDSDSAAPATSPSDPAPPQTHSVDAMIGHVNGEALYAHAILEPLDAQLAAFGENYDGDAFLQRAAAVIAGRLKEVLIDKLILAEAGGGLNDQERRAVDSMVRGRREEYLRYFGQGSLARAQSEFLASEGITLEEGLAQFREAVIVRRYLHQELFPRVNVQQRDVERLYYDLCEDGTYHSQDRRVIRLIMTRDSANADTIARRLDAGDAFIDLAADASLNQYSPTTGGQFNSGEPIEGDQVMGDPAVNTAILTLEEGQTTGLIVSGDRHFFVMLESFEPGVQVPLREVQAQLEQHLQLEQKDTLFRAFRQELWESGGYTDPVQMTEKLLDIAITRYDSAG